MERNKQVCYTPSQLIEIAKAYHYCRNSLWLAAIRGGECGGDYALFGLKQLSEFKKLIPEEFHSRFRVHGMEKIFRGATSSNPSWYSPSHPNLVFNS